MTSSSAHVSSDRRRRWLGVLARAGHAELEAMCERLRPLPTYAWLRRPEAGLVMVRARIGGTGAKFNVGEMTVTRCALQVEGGATGLGYVQGRGARRAELCALIDALMQDPQRREHVEDLVIAPLERLQHERRALAERKAAATRVEFYTVARGEAL
jgi:alpha-D-ribose 1-methylphosphonate 5-triphosphate synthase subunit PhnG